MPGKSYLAGMVRLEYAQNPGGFLSIGDKLSPRIRVALFTIIDFVFLGIVACLITRWWNMRLMLFFGLLLLLAGGLGNLVDRVTHHGIVTDFLVLGIWPIQTGIINVADMALTAGAIICASLYWRTNTDAAKSA